MTLTVRGKGKVGKHKNVVVYCRQLKSPWSNGMADGVWWELRKRQVDRYCYSISTSNLIVQATCKDAEHSTLSRLLCQILFRKRSFLPSFGIWSVWILRREGERDKSPGSFMQVQNSWLWLLQGDSKDTCEALCFKDKFNTRFWKPREPVLFSSND